MALVKLGIVDDEKSTEISRRVGSDGTSLFEGLISGDYEILVEHPHAETVSTQMHMSGIQTVEMSVHGANTQECVYGPPSSQVTLNDR